MRFNQWIWAVAVWVGLIFFSSTTAARRIGERGYETASHTLAKSPAAESDRIAWVARKGIHFSLFFILGALAWLTIEPHPRKNLAVLVFAFLTGCASEGLQWFFPLRTPMLFDIGLNFVSAALGLAMAVGARRLIAD